MMPTLFQRRTLLRSLGLATGSTLYPSLTRTARAASSPKRLLIYYTYQGTLPQFLVPKAGNETDFDINSLMEPYAAFKKDIVLLDGLDMKSAPASPNPGNAHQQGQNHALSAIRPVSASLAGGPSIDQVIARGLPTKTRFPSMELGVVDQTGFPSYHNVIYSGSGQQMPSEGSALKVWNNIFKGFVPMGGGSVPTPAAPDADKVKQKSVIDYVKNEIAALEKKMGQADKARLENHLTAVRDLENSLSKGSEGGGSVPGQAQGCEAVAQPMVGTFARNVDAQIKLIQMAFACDLTRVASLNVDELSHATSGYPSNAFGSSDAHDLVHRTSPDNGNLRDNVGAVEVMRKYHLVYAQVFNKLLTALSMPDVDGKRLLDNTIVLWAGEIALGSHSLNNLRWILAGSGGGAIRTGRWVKCGGAPHQNLFVSLARAMDVPIDTFGDPRTCTGPLAML